jgi:ADP-ribose pyrophosphatase
MAERTLEPCKVTDAREVYNAEPWLKVTRQQVTLLGGKVVDDYHRIELPDYTVILAETTEQKIVVERQYRHGAGEVTLVFPAGAIEQNELPVDADKRELLEETGYAADDWQPLGNFVVHGNYGCGRPTCFGQREQVSSPNPTRAIWKR